MPQPPYSPDLAPCDFFLFPKLKKPMKGRRYATLDEIKTASKEELKKILKNDFFEVLRRLEKPLAKLSLAMNRISRVDQDAISLILTPTLFRLDNNNLSSLPPAIFTPLVGRMSIAGGTLIVNAAPVLYQYLTVRGRAGNPFSCSGCEYLWVVINKVILRQVLIGFTCADGRSIDDLNLFNIGCP
ncbi:hypothetical protein LAZ67_21002714 [Cordylochernes scorpioides]|uniref:Uncharacterized protein n=1 Tax=Cordylochernes scorpioides TaxID=51811 RepID=A0ABY6LS27_9ARAC|nr:hypothetical protein LAZ67_21002714 [Cordylochernes scorpioides]